MWNIAAVLILFVVLVPGVLFSLDQTAIPPVVIHSVLFIAGIAVLDEVFKVRIEGFKDQHVEGWQLGNSCGTEYCKAPKYYCKENQEGSKYCSETE
jgi:hypothetical protein